MYISAVDGAAAEKCRDIIEAMTAEVKVGKIYNGRVVSIKDFGAFVEIAPETDGLCHVSELSDQYVDRVDRRRQHGRRDQGQGPAHRRPGPHQAVAARRR